MRTLIVGAGALGGTIAGRLAAAGCPVAVAARTPATAAALTAAGFRVDGFGGACHGFASEVGTVDAYAGREPFDLIVLATKARDAVELAPRLIERLRSDGTLLPIQNGGVSQQLADDLGAARVCCGLSNLGATMMAPGEYRQTNNGHLLIGEAGGGTSERVERVRAHLSAGIDVRVTPNVRGAMWSKLLLNCSVTTIGAIAGRTMREYIASAAGRRLFRQAYDEALTVALASGAQPIKMIVEPIPPDWQHGDDSVDALNAWMDQILAAYGDIKPSMLQDFERGRPTEIDFINGYVVTVGRRTGVATPANAAISDIVREITAGQRVPDAAVIEHLAERLAV